VEVAWETEVGPIEPPGPKEDPMALSWEDKECEPWSDRDAWRGDLYTTDDSTWRAGEPEVWEDVEEVEEVEPLDEGWPENLAGPEYWMYKKREE
jgi:hypothetical protein